ncbi:hypothetical protein BvCmsSINP006_03803 [Escherichia coli]|nr:hypothetical protein BvCmsSINP006_03803 [Escherichia coli]
MNIYDFFKKPNTCVRKGYRPSVIDCWSLSANNLNNVFKMHWEFLCEARGVLDMTVREAIIWILWFPVRTIMTLTYPFTFWIWGTVLYFILKGEVKHGSN